MAIVTYVKYSNLAVAGVIMLCVLVYQTRQYITGNASSISLISVIKFDDKNKNDKDKDNQGISPNSYEMSTFSNYTILPMPGNNDFDAFFKFVANTHTYCPKMIRAGKVTDGGWFFCDIPPFKPRSEGCLVYSFGINYDFTYDDDMANKYNCQVRSYDPSMNKDTWRDIPQGGSTKRSEKILFYKIGIAGRNIEPGHWKLQTFGTILADNKEQNKTIDMLKMDVEGAEFESFKTMFKEKSLQNVKQLAFEIHVRAGKYQYFFNILKTLEEIGFRKYLMTVNKAWPRNCFEMYYVNSRYFIS